MDLALLSTGEKESILSANAVRILGLPVWSKPSIPRVRD